MRVRQHYEHREGFQAVICARTGRLPFACSPLHAAVFLTLLDAQAWCVDLIAENAEHLGPFAIALIERYSGPVSVLELVD